VFYVFPDKKSADESAPTGASGFFVRHRRFVAGKWMFYLYAVTNDHALKDKAGRLFPNPAIRFNIEGKAESVDTNRLRWIRDENRDIAVTPLFNKEEYAHAHFLETHEFVEKNKIGNDLVEMGGWWGYGLGDEVFMVGRLLDHDGKEVNYPSIRSGMISMFPCAITDQEFLVECRSFGGYSGAPVFAGMDLTATTQRTRSLIKLLGINRGHAKAICDEAGNMINTGMTFVVPAWHIAEMLDSPEVIMESEKVGEEAKKSYRSLDAAKETTQTTDTGFEIPVPTQDEFIEKLAKASRKKK
jgi:hypothetical protein